jgi:hypothetical protein
MSPISLPLRGIRKIKNQTPRNFTTSIRVETSHDLISVNNHMDTLLNFTNNSKPNKKSYTVRRPQL